MVYLWFYRPRSLDRHVQTFVCLQMILIDAYANVFYFDDDQICLDMLSISFTTIATQPQLRSVVQKHMSLCENLI